MMGLSCECNYDNEPGMVIWMEQDNYTTLPTKTTKGCCSCSRRISPGEICVEVRRFKVPEHKIEIKIYGEESEDGPPRASKWMCERCADVMYSLIDLGYCAQPWENQMELLNDYVHAHNDRGKG